MPTVAIVNCPTYAPETVREALVKALVPFGGLDWVSPGMRIVIKANLVSIIKPENAATTHPSILAALTDLLVEHGANVVIGDSPGGLYNAACLSAVYAATGMKEAEKHGAKLNDDFRHKSANFPEAKAAKTFEYTAYLDEADAVINVCKLKTHGMMGLSAAVKNLFGVVPGTYKPEYHYRFPNHEAFADMLIDLNEYFRPRLNIVDAVVGMEGNGPTMGSPREIGAILASDNPYAADAVCARLIGLDPDEVEVIAGAKRRGLLPDEICLAGESPDQFSVRGFALPRQKKDLAFTREFDGTFGKFVGWIIAFALCARPAVRESQCVGCGKCAACCPAKAITMKNKQPRIDRKACIRCFCCQEFCVTGAMKVKRPVVARMLNR